jgi:cytochrome P450
VQRAEPELKGVIFHPYNAHYKQLKQQMLTILREFGFGRRLMETRILAEVDVVIEHIKALGGQEFNPRELLAMSVVNVVLNILFGHRWQYDDVELQQLIDDALENLSMEVDMFPVLSLLPTYKRRVAEGVCRANTVLSFAQRQVDICLQNTAECDNFVFQFAKMEGESLDRDELSRELRDLLAGAADTTATTLQFLLIHLANHDDIQRRLHTEVDSVVGAHRQPLLEDRSRMVFLEATLLEVLRMHSILPLSLPHETLCDTSVGGFHIPAHTMVMVNLYSAHRDPADWPHPDVFDPDRFIDSDGQLVNKQKMIAFSLGKRSCLGEQLARQELFLITAGLLQQFTILPPVGCQHIDDSERFKSGMIPAAFTVRLCPRH